MNEQYKNSISEKTLRKLIANQKKLEKALPHINMEGFHETFYPQTIDDTINILTMVKNSKQWIQK